MNLIKKYFFYCGCFVLMIIVAPAIAWGKDCPSSDISSEQLLVLPMDQQHYAGVFHCTASYDTKVDPKLPQSVLENLPVLLKDDAALVTTGFVGGRLWIMPKSLNKIFFTYHNDPGHKPTKESSVCLAKEIYLNRDKTERVSLYKLLPYYNQIKVTCKLGIGKNRVPLNDSYFPEWLEM